MTTPSNLSSWIEPTGDARDDGFEGTAVAVTGGGSGIGRMTALLLARCGADVTIGDLSTDALDEVTQAAADEGLSITAVPLDVTDPSAINGFLAEASSRAGRLDGLVCSAGIVLETPGLELSLETWNRVIGVNLTGTFVAIQSAARLMTETGGGSIVTVSSGQAFVPSQGLAHYGASKAGVIALTKAFALELGPHGIRVNNLAPGATDTPLFRSRFEDPEESVRTWNRSPLGRIGLALDQAEGIRFLLSNRSSWITGQTLTVNGGSFMH